MENIIEPSIKHPMNYSPINCFSIFYKSDVFISSDVDFANVKVYWIEVIFNIMFL